MEYYNQLKVEGNTISISSSNEMKSLAVGTIIVKQNGLRYQKNSKGQWKSIKENTPMSFQVVGTSLYIYTN